jgi:hypothetical protein
LGEYNLALGVVNINVPSRNDGKTRSKDPSTMVPMPADIPDFQIKHEASLVADAQNHGTPMPNVGHMGDYTPDLKDSPEPKLEPTVKVPNVEGLGQMKATKILKKNGLGFKTKGKKVGKVSKQSPKAGTRVKINSIITLTIGK